MCTFWSSLGPIFTNVQMDAPSSRWTLTIQHKLVAKVAAVAPYGGKRWEHDRLFRYIVGLAGI